MIEEVEEIPKQISGTFSSGKIDGTKFFPSGKIDGTKLNKSLEQG